jgi:hypothetical protein
MESNKNMGTPNKEELKQSSGQDRPLTKRIISRREIYFLSEMDRLSVVLFFFQLPRAFLYAVCAHQKIVNCFGAFSSFSNRHSIRRFSLPRVIAARVCALHTSPPKNVPGALFPFFT